MFAFEPSEEQQMFIEGARKFASKELREGAREADEHGFTGGWELGLLPASIPEKYGGFGERSAVTGVLAAEELAWGDLSGALALSAPNLVAFPVLLCGSEQQKAELLPQFCSNAYAPASAALIEPRYDFDGNALKTTATRSNGDFVVNGAKCNVPCAAEAEWMVAYASCDGRTEGFLIKKGTRGVEVKEREQNMGMKAFPLYSVDFHDCRAQRLGGEGGTDFQLLLNCSRVALAAMAVGVARGAYEYALEYAKNRKAFGEAIAQRQSIAFMLAEMYIDIEAARLMTWEAAWLLDQKRDATRAACLAKNFADEMALTVADRAVQTLGGHGYIRDYPVEMWLRNARGFAVLEGVAIV
ncbi:MAG: acyl-CoA dehydrogenase [Acidobacteria bacterium]|nr:MAG: acyl-CoA dehydrogenase [Acidobacteriota bacterium]